MVPRVNEDVNSALDSQRDARFRFRFGTCRDSFAAGLTQIGNIARRAGGLLRNLPVCADGRSRQRRRGSLDIFNPSVCFLTWQHCWVPARVGTRRGEPTSTHLCCYLRRRMQSTMSNTTDFNGRRRSQRGTGGSTRGAGPDGERQAGRTHSIQSGAQQAGEGNDDGRQARSDGGRGLLASKPSDIPARGWKDILWRVYENINNHRIMAVAAGVTFFILLALFPGIAALVSLYGYLPIPRLSVSTWPICPALSPKARPRSSEISSRT